MTAAWIIALFTSLPVEAQLLRRGIGPEPDSLHIHEAQGLSSLHVLREIREGLFTFDQAGEPVAGVAASWRVSEDGRTWRFVMRPDARWSNGNPVVAEDFVRAWRRALDPTTQARNAQLLSAFEGAAEIMRGEAPPETLGVNVVAPGVLELRLARVTPWLPEILAHPVSYPLHALDEGNPRAAPVNGAFVIAEAVPHAVIRLRPNTEFHDRASVKPSVVELYPIEDPAAELVRFRAGELDMTESIPPGRFEWLQQNLGDALRVSPYVGSFWLGLNLTRAPLKGNPALRQALSLAIDRDILTRVVLGAGEMPAWGIVPPGLGYPWTPASARLSGELRESEARRLFAEAGFDRRNAPTLELRYNTSSQHRRMAVAVAAMWKQVLGVSTTLINEEWKVFVNNRRQRVVTEVFRGGWIADYADPASFLDLFRGDDPMNWSGWSDPGFDELMKRATRLEGADRLGVLAQAERRLLDDMPVIPLYYYVSRHLVSPVVSGWTDNVRDIHLSRYLEIRTDAR
ncbi:MAG: peptide ABC transporter substrate-binding protein [Xanthomonadales bacterium]|nr:peptide ABC transporter substrate-binding protein [Xanthomonadales bacterium]